MAENFCAAERRHEERAWSAPDIAKARKLVARSHTRGMRVKVWAPSIDPAMVAQARSIVAALVRLGYKASLHADQQFPEDFMDSRRRVQIGAFPWQADYPAASTFQRGRLQDRLARVYEGRPLPLPSDRALTAVASRFGIPRALPEALLEGFAWDKEGRRYRDLAGVQAYAARVAGSVGA